MTASTFELTEDTLPIVEEIGGHMPGGFFIYQAQKPENLVYANKAVFDIFGCADMEEFRELTGFTFRGMVYPEDYAHISASIAQQISTSEDHMDYTEYRITRRDGKIRWVDDYGHYCETKEHGGVFVVFISDITEKRNQREEEFRQANAARITYGKVAQALAGDYFSIYVVDPDTDQFVEYSSTEEYDNLGVEKAGEDFFNLSRKNMDRLICSEDREQRQ